MNAKEKKILKRILFVTFGIVLIVFLSCYFILHYRTKYLIRQIVRIETNDTYDLDFSDLTLSLLRGDVKIKNASFYTKKNDGRQSSYQIKVPEFYFSLKSWRPLFTKRRLVVDSLYIGSPEIKVFQPQEVDTIDKPGFELRNIYDIIKETAANLKVRVLQIQEATVEVYPQQVANYSFKVDHINFTVANFKKREKKESNHFLLADDVDLFIRDQHWVLPNGNSIDFSSLHFSGKDQLFEIDSCLLKTSDKGDGNSAEIQASKFFFVSSQLTSAYLKGKLLIDTLSCINPVVELRSSSINDQADTVTLLTNSLTQLFKEIHFKYINVVDGQLSLLQNEDGRVENYQSQKANLRINDLDIHAGQPSSVRLRNIEFALDTVRFFSPDSAYVLKVAHFGIYDGDLTCENASFVPYRDDSEGMRLALPRITLRNISLQDLMQKRLKATDAEFNDPEIFVSSDELSQADSNQKTKTVNALYAALHSLRSLIDVEVVYVNRGDLHCIGRKEKIIVEATNMIAAINLNDLFQSDSLVHIKTALRQLSFDAIRLESPDVGIELRNVNLKGTTKESQIANAAIDLKTGMVIKASSIFWSQLDLDLLYSAKKVSVDKIKLGTLDVQYEQTSSNAKENHAPSFISNSVHIDNLAVAITLKDGSKIATNGKDLLVSKLSNDHNDLEWKDIRSRFENSTYTKAGLKIKAETSVLDKQNGSVLKNVTISTNNIEFLLPEVKLATTINNTRLSNLHLQYLVINEPSISARAGEDKSEVNFPFNLSADKVELNKAKISYRSGPEDSLLLTTFGDIKVDSLQMLNRGSEPLSCPSIAMQLTNAELVNKKVVASVPLANVSLLRSELQKTSDGKLSFRTDAKVQWMDASIRRRDSSKYVAHLSNLSGEFMYPALGMGSSKKITPGDIITRSEINDGNLFYSDTARSISADKLKVEPEKGNVEMKSIHIKPNLSKDSFFQVSKWQKDYMEISCDKLSVKNFDLQRYLKDTAINIEETTIENASLVTSRDKTIPFEHGIEKLMPTKLILSIERPFAIQRVIVSDANITSNEISSATKREGSAPFISVNGTIRNINNRPSSTDSLFVYANAIFLDHYIRTLQYRESYADSLSGFHMIVKVSPMDLRVLTKVTNPLAAIDIEKGRSDTLAERIAGNKYAAFGEMQFYYRGLKVRILDHTDTAKKNLVLSFKNFAANKFVIKTNNKKYSTIFFIRDTERFIFNYWVKTTFSGVITSTGIKNNKKYLKQFEEVKDHYSLPPRE